jgi:hypothetical protein
MQLFGLMSQFLECRVPFRIDLLLVSNEVAQQNPPVGPDFPMTDLAAVQQFDEVGSGDIQQIGGLLRGQFGVHRQQRHSIAFGHLRKHIE